MARIKHTKTELKAQSDALRRYRHFLPMLQLKKQQLQAEIAHTDQRITAVRQQEKERHAGIEPWIQLFGTASFDPSSWVRVRSVVTEGGNIAGVPIPLFKEVEFERTEVDLFDTPAWFDEALAVFEALAACRAERGVLEAARRRVAEELHVTAQRVNLFEKVKIPECRENIRVIRIFLGDEQTAAVARGKIAKRRSDQRRRQETAA